MSTTRIVRELAILVALALLVFGPGAMLAFAQAPPAGPDLVSALKNTPGCLGVEVAKTGSGKQVIFAWFENKQALLGWYHSDVHQALMKSLAPGAASAARTPLELIKEDSGPILAVASLTFAEKGQVNGIRMPVSQIAIELYAPLPGGLAAGGRFAPSAVKVPGLIEGDGKP
jgi:hypothetical protein